MKKQGHSYAGNLVVDRVSAGFYKKILSGKGLYILNPIIMAVSCFLMGRAFIFDEMSPFGVAFFAVTLYKHRSRFMAFIAILAGMLSVHIGGFIFKYMATMGLLLLIYNVLSSTRIGRSRLVLATITTLTLFGANIVYKGLAPGGVLQYDYILAALEGVIVFALVYVFDNVLSVILEAKKRRILSNEEMISMGIFAALLIVGMWDVKVYALSMRNILSVLFIIIAAHIGGVGIGAAMGVLMGLVLSMASGPDPILVAVLGVCGLISGTFRDLGKIVAGLTFLLANALMSFYISQSTLTIISFREILASIGILILIPKKALNTLRQFLDYSLMRFKEQNYYINRMQELTVSRLNEFSSVFKELAAAFGHIPHSAPTDQEEISRLFDIISGQVCSSCPLYGSCWRRDFCSTYNGMFNLITTIESKGTLDKTDLNGHLPKNCIHTDKLVEVIEQVYVLYKSNLKWKAKIQECRQLVGQQLDGVSEVVGQLAEELDISIEFKKDLEESISLELDKAGIRTKEVLVIEKAGGVIEVNIHKNPCNGRRDCTRRIERIVTKVIGRRMTVGQSPCTAIKKKTCTLKLTEAMEFQVSTGIARKAGQPGGISGDSYSFNPLPDGKYMLALSDGMGIGDKAAQESRVVISLLENFLEAGFDMNTTIRTINSTLLLRSQDEIFATADLCLLDLVSGIAEFVKIGAVSTFIKRKDSVEVVKASSLPIGILDSVQPEIASLRIHDEDMIIMVTDGVPDNTAKGVKADDWLVKVIGSYDTRNPQEMADYLMEAVVSASSPTTAFGDDMTIMATRVWKPVI